MGWSITRKMWCAFGVSLIIILAVRLLMGHPLPSLVCLPSLTLGGLLVVFYAHTISRRGWGWILFAGVMSADLYLWKGVRIPIKGELALDYLGSIFLTGSLLAYLAIAKEVSFKKIFFGSLVAADLYSMVHIVYGPKGNQRMVLSFGVLLLFLSSIPFLYNLVSIKSETEGPRLNFFTKIGLGIFKVIAGTQSRLFWLMSTLYFAGVMVIIQPGHKPPWAWWVGGVTTLMYIVFNLEIMCRNDKEIEARFTQPSQRQEIPMPPLRQDPHPGGVDRIDPVQPEVRNRTIGIYVDGVRVGRAQLSPEHSRPLLKVLPEPDLEPNPETRLARVLRDDYPL